MQTRLLAKTDFMNYLECPLSLWLKTFRPDLMPAKDPGAERILAMGREVDSFARKLFPEGVEIDGFHHDGWRNAQKAMREGARTLFQPTVVAGNLSARADMLVKNERTDAWDLYEVKMATSLKKEYVFDAGFQALCLANAGLPVGRIFIVHINKHYVRSGDINPKELFIAHDVTQAVSEAMPTIQDEALRAEAFMQQGNQSAAELLNLCGRPRYCEYLPQAALAFPDAQNYAPDIKVKTLFWMLERGLADYRMIPDELLDGISFEKPKTAVAVNREGIARELEKLRYPLYFFDYETYASPLPPFEGTKPYQNIPFQYSLSIQDAPGGPLRHEHFLADRFENPIYELLSKLKQNIGPAGSVVVWFAPFESRRNQEMAMEEQEFADFLAGLNERMYDLMLLFKPKNNLYRHSAFKGSASLKVVLPVLCPELSYKDLTIQEGATAAASWPQLASDGLSAADREKLRKDMLDYCRRDTDAMAAILDKVRADV